MTYAGSLPLQHLSCSQEAVARNHHGLRSSSSWQGTTASNMKASCRAIASDIGSYSFLAVPGSAKSSSGESQAGVFGCRHAHHLHPCLVLVSFGHRAPIIIALRCRDKYIAAAPAGALQTSKGTRTNASSTMPSLSCHAVPDGQAYHSLSPGGSLRDTVPAALPPVAVAGDAGSWHDPTMLPCMSCPGQHQQQQPPAEPAAKELQGTKVHNGRIAQLLGGSTDTEKLLAGLTEGSYRSLANPSDFMAVTEDWRTSTKSPVMPER